MMVLVAKGKGANDAFRHEPGGHRWQRVPPNEKRGRVHTSTVTVAVLAVPEALGYDLDDTDLEWKACRGSGAGGQHRNKRDTAIQLRHKPTGIMVRCEAERSQHANRQTARAMLAARLEQAEADRRVDGRNATRRAQVGTGMRADKVRTIALQRDQVTDHRLGRRMSAKRYLKGELDKLVA